MSALLKQHNKEMYLILKVIAVVVLKTADNSQIGTIRFYKTKDKTKDKIKYDTNLDPHKIYIHKSGDLSKGCDIDKDVFVHLIDINTKKIDMNQIIGRLAIFHDKNNIACGVIGIAES